MSLPLWDLWLWNPAASAATKHLPRDSHSLMTAPKLIAETSRFLVNMACRTSWTHDQCWKLENPAANILQSQTVFAHCFCSTSANTRLAFARFRGRLKFLKRSCLRLGIFRWQRDQRSVGHADGDGDGAVDVMPGGRLLRQWHGATPSIRETKFSISKIFCKDPTWVWTGYWNSRCSWISWT